MILSTFLPFRPTRALAHLATLAEIARKILMNVLTIPATAANVQICSMPTSVTAKALVSLVKFANLTSTSVWWTIPVSKAVVRTCTAATNACVTTAFVAKIVSGKIPVNW